MTAREEIINCFNSQRDKFDPMPSEDIVRQFMDNMSEKQAQALIDAASAFLPEGFGGPGATAAFILNFLLTWNTALNASQGNPETIATLKEHISHNIVYNGTEAENNFFKELASILSGGEAGPLKSFKSIALDKYLIPTGKVPRGLTEREKGAAEVIPAHGKTPAVKTSFILYFANEDVIKIMGHKTISKFDMAILNGVISLIARGNIAITPAMAYRAVAGWGTEHEVTPKQEEAAQKSIERLRITFVQIDATEEVKAYCSKKGIKGPKSWKYNDALLSCKAGEITQINGKKVKAYLFDNYDKKGNLKMPIIMEYAQISGQILALPMELSDMPVSATESNIILKNYLWVQIGAIRNTKTARRQEIAYEGIYKELGIDVSTSLGRKQAQRAREATASLLENWKKKGAIKGFSTYNKDRKAAGVKVEV